MWKQWTNFILGILVALLAFTAVPIGWIAAMGALIAILALWAGLERSPAGTGVTRPAH